MTAGTPNRLSRLLAMVPYFLARPGIETATAAADLGLTEAQLIKDLEQLFVCGLPGYHTDDLIDIQFYEGYVNVVFAAGIDRPLRLTGTEASILLVALRTLLDSPGVTDVDATLRAIAKIEEAAGEPSSAVVTPSSPAPDNPVFGILRSGVSARKALRITYFTASRDAVTERVIDPIRVQVLDSNTYLEAWCRRSEGLRMFRFDRVQAAEVLDEPSRPPVDSAENAPVTAFAETLLSSARVEVDPEYFWIFEYYSAVPDHEPLAADGPVPASIAYGSPDWLARLLLGFGGHVRLLGNDSQTQQVRQLIADAAAAALARY